LTTSFSGSCSRNLRFSHPHGETSSHGWGVHMYHKHTGQISAMAPTREGQILSHSSHGPMTSGYNVHHSQSANVELGLFLRFPWLPYIIGFISIWIVIAIFLFFYSRIQKKKREIQDERKSVISSRKSSLRDMHTIISMTGTTSSNSHHHSTAVRCDNYLSSTPIQIPHRSRAHSSSHHAYIPKLHHQRQPRPQTIHTNNNPTTDVDLIACSF